MYMQQNAKLTDGYKKLIFGFVIITIILIVVILYFSASHASIIVKPRMDKAETDFVADVVTDGGLTTSALPGVLFETEVEDQVTGTATGTKVLEGNSIGSVRLINKRAEDQILVKTTRLLSKDDILLRLSDRVTIPANGEITALVYADDPTTFDVLQPTSFIIPGLWEGLQDQVYAESEEVLTSSGESVKTISEVDIASAKEQLTRELAELARDKFSAEMVGLDLTPVVVEKTVLQEELSNGVGDPVDSFTVKMKVRFVLMGLNTNDIISLATERLKSVVNQDRELLAVNLENFTYTVQNYDAENRSANIKVHIDGNTVINATNDIFNKDKLAGLSPKGVELYLANYDQIESVQVELAPFWVKKVPNMKDRIEIIIQAD